MNNNTTSSELANRYNTRYKKNTYIKQFNKQIPIPTYDNWLINHTFKKAWKIFKKEKKKVFKILDFGCGDGRMFNTLNKISIFLLKRSISLEIINFDIAEEGLKRYSHNLINKGFSPTNKKQKELLTLKKDNITIKFIAAKPDYKSQFLLDNIDKVDMSLAMFDVINHIPKKSHRIEALKTLKKVTNYYLVFSVTSPVLFKREQFVYSYLREMNSSFKSAMEKGDIYYPEFGEKKGITDFMHIYTAKELRKNVRQAGWKLEKLSIAAITDIIKNKPSFLNCKIDEYLSRIISKILPFWMLDKIGINLAVVVKSK